MRQERIRTLIHTISGCLNDNENVTDELVTLCRETLEDLVEDDNIEFENYPDTDSIISDLKAVEQDGDWRPRLLSDVRYVLLELLDRQKNLNEAASRYFNN